MGQTLSRKPISQRQSFATLNTASNPFGPPPDMSQATQMSAGPAIGTPDLSGGRMLTPDQIGGAGIDTSAQGQYLPPSVLGAGFSRFGIGGRMNLPRVGVD